MVMVGTIYQLIISFANALLLYKLTFNLTKNATLAYNATMIFIVNHSMIYSIALYSEPTYIFLCLLGFNVMYGKVDPLKISYTV